MAVRQHSDEMQLKILGLKDDDDDDDDVALASAASKGNWRMFLSGGSGGSGVALVKLIRTPIHRCSNRRAFLFSSSAPLSSTALFLEPRNKNK